MKNVDDGLRMRQRAQRARKTRDVTDGAWAQRNRVRPGHNRSRNAEMEVKDVDLSLFDDPTVLVRAVMLQVWHALPWLTALSLRAMQSVWPLWMPRQSRRCAACMRPRQRGTYHCISHPRRRSEPGRCFSSRKRLSGAPLRGAVARCELTVCVRPGGCATSTTSSMQSARHSENRS